MVDSVKRLHPHTLLVVVGFSLGGNIVCKFLGEKPSNQNRVVCCISVCQGYSALRWVEGRMPLPVEAARRNAQIIQRSKVTVCVRARVCVKGPGNLPAVGSLSEGLQLYSG